MRRLTARATLRRRVLLPAFLLMLAILLGACAGTKEVTEEEEIPPFAEDSTAVDEPVVTVTVEQENLRRTPNGMKVGTAPRGASFPMEERRGNWVNVQHPEHGSVWIWAPSLGFDRVDPFSVPFWLGDEQPRQLDSLQAVVGPPLQVESLGGDVFIYRYPNLWPERDATRFGTYQFNEAVIWVDRVTRTVLRLEFKLPPFQGGAKKLLAAVHLPAVSSTKTDFERARYEDSFPGIAQLELFFLENDFDRIRFLAADRFAADAFEDAFREGEKKIVYEDGDLSLSMKVTNTSELAFAALSVKVGLYTNMDLTGEYSLGPLKLRVEPGESETLVAPLPVDATGLDINTLAAQAEIVSAIAVPPATESAP